MGASEPPESTIIKALAGAEAALQDHEFIALSRTSNYAGIAQLSEGLQDLGIGVAPSAGNFVLADLQQDPMPVYEALLQAGIIVRPVGNYGLDTHLRITVGTRVQNDALLSALAKIEG